MTLMWAWRGSRDRILHSKDEVTQATIYGILKCVKNKVESHIFDCWMLSASVLISSE